MTKDKSDQKPESEPVSGPDVASLVKLITNLTGREPTQQELKEAQDTLSGKRAPSSYVSVAWPPFAQKLAATLEKVQEDQYLILSVKRSNRFVQFAVQGSFGIRVETTSNSYVSKEELLRTADHLVIVVPYSAASHHAIGAAELARMKPSATLAPKVW